MVVICSAFSTLVPAFYTLVPALKHFGPCILHFGPCILHFDTCAYQGVSGTWNVFTIQKPFKGPFRLKKETGRSPIIVVGTISKIKTRDTEVNIGDQIKFTDGQERQFDAIVFATSFKSTVRKWLKVNKVTILNLFA
ncbi:putative indole-3-pyruvate monooxygenase [Helianthus anomalus]